MKEYTTEDIKALERNGWSGKEFGRRVMQQLLHHGYRRIHLRPAYTGAKWKHGKKAGKDMIITPYDGEPGFPDVVAGKLGRRGIAWELKSLKDIVRPGQLEWIEIFAALGFDARVCYPRDWDSMMLTIERGL